MSNVRKVVIDLSTTGLDPLKGHRVFELAAVEILGTKLSKRGFHRYVNPDREMSLEAENIYGLSWDDLRGKPKCCEIVNQFINFIGESKLIGYNVCLDTQFLRCEYLLAGHVFRLESSVIDIIQIAKEQQFERLSLKDLCKHFCVSYPQSNCPSALDYAATISRLYLAMTA